MVLTKSIRSLYSLSLSMMICLAVSACGGGGGSSSDATIQGTLGTSAAKIGLIEGSAGVGGVTVSALGDSDVTDESGNFVLKADGNQFTGGPVVFSLSGNGIDTSVSMSNVAGGPGGTAYVDLTVDANGFVAGTSTDADGNVIATVASFGCTENQSFLDGGGGRLWKPISESTGTAVILMPAEFQRAALEVLNANGDSVASVIKSSCCDHNGGRDHRFLSRSASSLAGEPLPLTVRYSFPEGRVVCLEVGTPTARLD